MKATTVTTTAEIRGTNRSIFLDELEDQPLPFEWRQVASRTLWLYLDGEETPVHILRQPPTTGYNR